MSTFKKMCTVTEIKSLVIRFIDRFDINRIFQIRYCSQEGRYNFVLAFVNTMQRILDAFAAYSDSIKRK